MIVSLFGLDSKMPFWFFQHSHEPHCLFTDLSVTNYDPIPTGIYKSEGALTLGSSNVKNGSNVVFTSDTSVQLNALFEVLVKGVFEILIEGCPSNWAGHQYNFFESSLKEIRQRISSRGQWSCINSYSSLRSLKKKKLGLESEKVVHHLLFLSKSDYLYFLTKPLNFKRKH